MEFRDALDEVLRFKGFRLKEGSTLIVWTIWLARARLKVPLKWLAVPKSQLASR